MRVRFANSATNYVEGLITSYDSYTSTDILIEVDHIVGSGTFTNWTVGIAGDPVAIAGLSDGFIPKWDLGQNKLANGSIQDTGGVVTFN